jgi:hypothetical protein
MAVATRTRLRPATSPVALAAWAVSAAPGKQMTYWRGHLAQDIWPLAAGLPEAERQQLREVGRLAWALAQDGYLHLLQRRLGPNEWAYIAVARAKPRPAAAVLAVALAQEPA